MPKITFPTSVIMLAAMFASSAYADKPYMPYMNEDGPEPREIFCLIAENGMQYHNGKCYFQAGEGGDFTVLTGNTKYAATVHTIEGNTAIGMWTGEPYASHMHGAQEQLIRSSEDPACWENESFAVCAW